MGSKCRLCKREFATHDAFLHHWRDKHTGSSGPRQGRGSWKFLVIIILIVGATLVLYHSSQTSTTSSSGIHVGDDAPDFHVTLLNGADVSLSQFRGHPVLLWFVTTWCSTCQQGAQMLASQYYAILHSKGVVILVVELYDNLGQPGPSLSQFAEQFGGGATKPDWYYGTSSRGTTYTYDPKAYLDVYYLLDSQGKITTEGVGLPDGLRSIASHL